MPYLSVHAYTHTHTHYEVQRGPVRNVWVSSVGSRAAHGSVQRYLWVERGVWNAERWFRPGAESPGGCAPAQPAQRLLPPHGVGPSAPAHSQGVVVFMSSQGNDRWPKHSSTWRIFSREHRRLKACEGGQIEPVQPGRVSPRRSTDNLQ